MSEEGFDVSYYCPISSELEGGAARLTTALHSEVKSTRNSSVPLRLTGIEAPMKEFTIVASMLVIPS